MGWRGGIDGAFRLRGSEDHDPLQAKGSEDHGPGMEGRAATAGLGPVPRRALGQRQKAGTELAGRALVVSNKSKAMEAWHLLW